MFARWRSTVFGLITRMSAISHQAQAATNHRVVVGEQDPGHAAQAAGRGRLAA